MAARVVLENRSGGLRLTRGDEAGDYAASALIEPGGTGEIGLTGRGRVLYDVGSGGTRLGVVQVVWAEHAQGGFATQWRADAVTGRREFVFLPVSYRVGGADVTDPGAVAAAFGARPSPGSPEGEAVWVYELLDVLRPASDEGPDVVVPDVVGAGVFRAYEFLAGLGLQMSQGETVVSAPEATWTVLTQDPGAGVHTVPGDVVHVTVGGGPPVDPERLEPDVSMPAFLPPPK